MLRFALLENRSVIALTGPESRSFLQGLISNDMEQCRGQNALYAGLLTPQGKILFEFFILEARPDSFLIDCPATRAGDLLKRLGLYKLRAKVEISATDLAVAALWDAKEAPIIAEVSVFADPRLSTLGFRLIGRRNAVAAEAAAHDGGHYAAHRLDEGVPDSADLPPDTVFALDAGFEELNGVSFRKGCYVGQEVTARMKHRATARRRMLIAHADPLPTPGTALTADDREIGTFASGEGGRALAMIRLDRLAEAEAANIPILAAGRPVTLQKPSWLRV